MIIQSLMFNNHTEFILFSPEIIKLSWIKCDNKGVA